MGRTLYGEKANRALLEATEKELRRREKEFNRLPVKATITVRFVSDENELIAEAYNARNQSICILGETESETAKIRKHNHDTLWAVLAGFVACGALVVVFGLIIIGILSYARG